VELVDLLEFVLKTKHVFRSEVQSDIEKEAGGSSSNGHKIGDHHEAK
jgi:hypothetical protein